jgi:F0F1-type ATP synthase gamma subunit
MSNVNEYVENEELDEEDHDKDDAAISAALSRILAQNNSKNKNLSTYELTKKDWILLGSSNGLDFYLGSICSEVAYKFPNTFKGKVRFWDEHIRVLKGQKTIAIYKVEYIGGFRENLNDAIERLSLQYSA